MTLFGGVKIIEILCAVVRNKLLAVLVGPAGVGLNAIFNRSLDMVSSTTQLNVRQSSVRDLSSASGADRPAVISAVKWWALRLGLAGALVMLILSPGFSWFSFDSASSWWLFALVAIPVLVQSVTNGDLAVMQGTDRLKPLAKSQIWTALASMIVCVVCYAAFGLNGIVPGLVGAYVLSFFITRYCRGPVPDLKLSYGRNVSIGKRFLGLGFSLGLATAVSSACAYVFIAWITREAGEDETGIFQAGHMLIINYAGLVFMAISMEFYPRLVKVIHRPKFASIIISHEISTLLLVLIPVIAIFIPAAQLMIKVLYSARFLAAVPMVTIGICSTVFRAVSFCMAFAIIARGDGKIYIVTETVSSVAGLALNIILYKVWGFTGLGISYIIWYALYTLIVAIPFHYRYGLRLNASVIYLAIAALLLSGISYALNLAGLWASLVMAAVCATFCARRLIRILFSRQ